jgi:hypothetical protein
VIAAGSRPDKAARCWRRSTARKPCGPEQDEGLEECLDAWIGKTQAGGALAAGYHRSVDGLQGAFAENAIVAQPFDFDEALIGRESDRAQLRKIMQAFADAEVVSVVDGRLGP